MGENHTFDAAEYDYHTKIRITDVTRTGNRAEWGTSTGNAKMRNGNNPNLNRIQ